MRFTVATLSLLGVADAFWRLPCRSRTGLARLDPLVDPGTLSDHAHAIMGGGNFGMNSDYNSLMESECTSCEVTQDRSAYWVPTLNFMYPNGTMVMVQQVGGMLAYYDLFGQNITAFPAGFRMLAGDTRQRNFSGLPVPDPPTSFWTATDFAESALRQKALGFNCLNYSPGVTPEGTIYRHFMPDKNFLDNTCPDGLRLELVFPSCWNGKDLDSDDHKSHMRYSSFVLDGTCPEGYETRVPTLLYEVIWATNAFKGVAGQFVLSNGDPTGYGYHGDFIAAWDPKLLQSAIETCTNPSGEIEDCPVFKLQSDDTAAKCTFDMPQQLVKDDCAGPRDGLCGNVPIQSGPGYASKIGASQTAAPTSKYSAPTDTQQTLVPTLSYASGSVVRTDNSGGKITVARANQAAAEQPTDAATSSAAATSAAAASSSAPMFVESNTTPAPSMPSASSAAASILSTMTYTSDGKVWNVAVQEVVETVTAAATTVVQQQKRHAHIHRHRNRHHEGMH